MHASVFRTLIGIGSHSNKALWSFLLVQRVPAVRTFPHDHWDPGKNSLTGSIATAHLESTP